VQGTLVLQVCPELQRLNMLSPYTHCNSTKPSIHNDSIIINKIVHLFLFRDLDFTLLQNVSSHSTKQGAIIRKHISNATKRIQLYKFINPHFGQMQRFQVRKSGLEQVISVTMQLVNVSKKMALKGRLNKLLYGVSSINRVLSNVVPGN
jgi:hypothetical protein